MASADYRVLTPERVSLQYDIAGVGSRGAAALVDLVIQVVTLLVVLVGLGAAVPASGILEDGGVAGSRLETGLILGAAALAVFTITNGYFMLFEIVWNGQTPGKRLVGVRVMRENGYPIRPLDAVVRNLVRIADWLPLGYGVGVLVMLLNQRSKRLGDFASGTIVVREAARAAAVELEAYARRGGGAASGGVSAGVLPSTLQEPPRAPVLSAVDATLVRDFLLRRASMHATARAGLAGRIASALSVRYGLPLEGAPEHFLELLVD